MAAADQSKKSVSSESDRNDKLVNSRNLSNRSDPASSEDLFWANAICFEFPALKDGSPPQCRELYCILVKRLPI